MTEMDLSPELENYIQQSIECAVGLPVSKDAFRSKLFAVEESRRVLQGQVFALQDLLNDRNEKLERAKISKLNKECSLYDNDREALMEFGNDADERARQAEACAQEAEDNSRRLSDEVNQSKQEIELLMADKTRHLEELQLLRHRIVDLENERDDDNSVCPQCSNIKDVGLYGSASVDESLLRSLLESTLVKGNAAEEGLEDFAARGRIFLEAHVGEETHWRLIQLWEKLKPSNRYVVALAAEVDTLRQEKENLRVNLYKAEGEVSALFEENKLLDEENRKLLRRWGRERSQQGSPSSHSAKSKRKASPRMSSASERSTDIDGSGSPRRPLSPLEYNVQATRLCSSK
ncbi:uncharacterized protein LOC116248579 isoform X2 [Nymphaea colorata]|uniref:uncharacterized protein LOC116248579 isoform X2 n=1 Tax=Nymphaea colorata TaxID=210225 RepID=UPI00214F4FA3|nr:uncharacterized protein LOC116248579 isoform X2 [Nymphaea colorata]